MQLHNTFDFILIHNKKRRDRSKGYLAASRTAQRCIFSVLNQCHLGGSINGCQSNAQAPQKRYILLMIF